MSFSSCGFDSFKGNYNTLNRRPLTQELS